MPPASIRLMTDADVGLIHQVLYMALGWNPEKTLPPVDVVMAVPEVARFHRGWGRPGDLGIAAESGGEFVGGAFYRLFTDEDHGHGYVDPETPEVGVAVVAGRRGRPNGAAPARPRAPSGGGGGTAG